MKTNKESQQDRRNHLNKGTPVTAYLGDDMFKKLQRLSITLGYQKPVKGQNGVLETYKAVIEHLINLERLTRAYQPKSKEAKLLYKRHKQVWHLIKDQGLTINKAAEYMNNNRIDSISSDRKWNKEMIKNYLNIEKVVSKMQEIDNAASQERD